MGAWVEDDDVTELAGAVLMDTTLGDEIVDVLDVIDVLGGSDVVWVEVEVTVEVVEVVEVEVVEVEVIEVEVVETEGVDVAIVEVVLTAGIKVVEAIVGVSVVLGVVEVGVKDLVLDEVVEWETPVAQKALIRFVQQTNPYELFALSIQTWNLEDIACCVAHTQLGSSSTHGRWTALLQLVKIGSMTGSYIVLDKTRVVRS
jgi:hypothetical protein